MIASQVIASQFQPLFHIPYSSLILNGLCLLKLTYVLDNRRFFTFLFFLPGVFDEGHRESIRILCLEKHKILRDVS